MNSLFFALPADHLLIKTLLGLHIGAGSGALLSGLVPMLGRKGGPTHVRAGRLYVACMLTVAGSALLLCGLQPLKMSRVFLAGVAVLSFYLSFTGWRAARRRTLAPALPDRLLSGLALTTGLAMLAAGVGLQIVLFGFFGLLLSVFAGGDVWRSARATRPATPWLLGHIPRMGGSYIAAVTAVLVVNLGHLLPADAPGWLGLAGWLAPSFVGGMLIRRTLRHYRARLAGRGAVGIG